MLSTKKGTLGSAPTLPPASQASQAAFCLLDCFTKSSKYWLNLTCEDKLTVPSTNVDIGFSALPNNFCRTSLPLGVKSFISTLLCPTICFLVLAKVSATDLT